MLAFSEVGGKLFDTTHCLYIVITFALTLAVLIVFSFVKNQKIKDCFLLFWALATMIIHYSVVWVNFFENGGHVTYFDDCFLFPIYYCNIAMFFGLVVAIWPNKKSRFFQWMATFQAYAGTIGGILAAFYPNYYIGYSLAQWGVAKSMISHSTLLVQSLWLFVGGYVKLDFFNVVPLIFGNLFCGFLGYLTNGIYAWAKLPTPNAMYLVYSPIPQLPIFNGWTIMVVMIVLVCAFNAAYEGSTRPRERRWFNYFGEKLRRVFTADDIYDYSDLDKRIKNKCKTNV